MCLLRQEYELNLKREQEQNRAEPQSLQPEKQEKVQSKTALFFMPEAKVAYKET